MNSDSKLYKTLPTPYVLYQSKIGNYFIGQTEIFGKENFNSLALLVNPSDSGVNIYLNAITITNILGNSISAEICVNSKATRGFKSNLVSCANLAIKPTPDPKGEIKYSSKIINRPKGSIPIFTRIVSPYSTLVIDGGQIIIPPGESLAVYIGKILPVETDNIIVALGWWEEKIHDYHCV